MSKLMFSIVLVDNVFGIKTDFTTKAVFMIGVGWFLIVLGFLFEMREK